MKYLVFMLSSLSIFLSVDQRPSVAILCYHAFLDRKNQYCFSIQELRSHILYFKRRGYTFVSFSDVVHNRITGNKNILVTIDDGNRSVYRAYREVFKPHNIKPVIAVYTGIINRAKYALTWKQLQELSRDGCHIASHGYYHRKLTNRLYRREKRAFIKEVAVSKKILEKKLGKKVDVYIYPYGVTSDAAVSMLEHYGYRYALTIRSGQLKMPGRNKALNAYRLPRYMITRSNWKHFFNLIVKGNHYSSGTLVAKGRKAPAGTIPPGKKEKAEDPVRRRIKNRYKPVPETGVAAATTGPSRINRIYPKASRDSIYYSPEPSVEINDTDLIVETNSDRPIDTVEMTAVISQPADVEVEKYPPDEGILRGVMTNGNLFYKKRNKVKRNYYKLARRSYRKYEVFMVDFRKRVRNIKRRIVGFFQ